MPARSIRIGCAGWSVPKQHGEQFAATGSHLQKYASRLNAVEINSSFYRSHQAKTYARWASETPDGFRFSAKIPRQITHRQRLADSEEALAQFLGETSHLGNKRGPLLVQLPPSLKLDVPKARRFFEQLRAGFDGFAACEPRHATWFTSEAEALLTEFRIARVAADPRQAESGNEPAGFSGLAYFRLHGSPKVYYSDYSESELAAWAERIERAAKSAKEVWCIFDNTAEGFATANALWMTERLGLG